MPRVRLAEVAHARTGEKGDQVNLAILAYRREHYDALREQLTEERIRERYGGVIRGSVRRFEAPGVLGLNFVLGGALGGGRSRTLAFDESGKALSSAALDIEVDVPEGPRGRPETPVDPLLAPPAGQRIVRVGMGSGWWGDRMETAVDLVRGGRLAYICFDTMSEVTMSAHQVWRQRDPSRPPYDPYLVKRLGLVLPEAIPAGTRIVTNQGWLDPIAAAERVAHLASQLGFPGTRIAAVGPVDLLPRAAELDLRLDDGRSVVELGDQVVSAEAYLGAWPVAEALDAGADVVVTPRVADSALVLGPLLHEFRWEPRDWDRLAAGSTAGHLIECGAQVTGGYFADPGYKDIPDPARLSLPIAEVSEDGSAWISKLDGTGGEVSPATCAEQLLYEVEDPALYALPDVAVDLRGATLGLAGRDLVRVAGARGRPRPDRLKVLVGLREGYLAEEMLCYAGPNALARAELAREILLERFRMTGLGLEELRIDFVGVNAVHREASRPVGLPYEVIVRVAARTRTQEEAHAIRQEVDPMAVNGPAGTGKWSPAGQRVRPLIGLHTAYVDRSAVRPRVHVLPVS